MRLRAGETVQGLEIVGLLGEGATSEVYLARDEHGKERALKLLSVHGRTHRRRMRTEGEALRDLRHPNVVSVYEMVDHEGWLGVLMEFVRGPTLHRWLDAEHVEIDEAVLLLRGMLAGVDAMHQAGLVHRDLKPGNVILDVDGDGVRPRLVDFGLVKKLMDVEHQTMTGASMGTPAYMAPEQLKDASRVDGRADIFSLGCMFFEMLVGRPPFRRDDWWETYKAIEEGEAADLSLLPDHVSPGIRATLEAMLQPDPDRRASDAVAVLTLLDGSPPERPLPSPTLPLHSPGTLRAMALAVEVDALALARDRADLMDLRGIAPDTLNEVELVEMGLLEPVAPSPPARRTMPLGRTAAVAATVMAVLLALLVWWVALPTSRDMPKVVPLDGLPQAPSAAATTQAPAVSPPASTPPPAAAIRADVPSASPQDPDGVAPTADAEGPPPRRVGGTRGPASAASDTEIEPAGAGPTAAPVTLGAGAATARDDLPAGSGIVRVAGDAHRVALLRPDGERFALGAVPTGTYTLSVQWRASEPEVSGGQVQVEDGANISLRCISDFLVCAP